MSAVAQPAQNIAPLPDIGDIPIQQMASYRPGKATLLSIWPIGQVHRTYHAGMIEYGHPAAEKDKIKLILLNPERVTIGGTGADGQTHTARSFLRDCQHGQGYVRIDVFDTYTTGKNWEANTTVQYPISATAVAEMLCRVFSGGRPGDGIYGAPGIKVYDPRQTLEEQLAELDARQRQYAEYLFNEAEQLAAAGHFKDITNLHRVMARWLMVDAPKWGVASLARGNSKTCVNCQKPVPKAAVKCIHAGCGTNYVELYDQYGMCADDDAVLNILVMRERKRSEQPASSPAAPAPVVTQLGPGGKIRN